MKRTPICVTIAGSDPCAGAGIQADLKAFSMVDAYGMSVITASTVQSHLGLDSLVPLESAHISSQLTMLLETYQVAAIKTGMLYSGEVIHTISEVLKKHPKIPLVVDPVLSASVGANWNSETICSAYRDELMPLATVITPNYPEAQALFGEDLTKLSDIAQKNGTSIYLKGGHNPTETESVCDIVFQATGNSIELQYPRIHTTNTHGTGCTLASLLAGLLAQNIALEDAARQARELLQRLLIDSKGFLCNQSKEPHINLPLLHSITPTIS